MFPFSVATERWTQLTIGGDVFTPRTFHVASVLVKNGVQYVAVYGGVNNYLGNALPIQDFALLDLSTLTWKNMGKTVTASQYYYDFTDRTCCATCDASACPLARFNAKGIILLSSLF